MLYYYFDGSFAGFLTVIFYSYAHKQPPLDIICGFTPEVHLVGESKFIAVDHVLADRVGKSIPLKMGERAVAHAYYCLLSGAVDSNMAAYNYLTLGWNQLGQKLDNSLAVPEVKKAHLISSRVRGERHRLLGLTRFQDLGGVFYAPLTPDNDVIALMARHFAARLPDQKWVLHDLKRQKAVVSENGKWQLISLTQEQISLKTSDQYEDLWLKYFNAIAIKERTNLRQQKACMPRRYWQYLPEMQGRIGENNL